MSKISYFRYETEFFLVLFFHAQMVENNE